MKRLATALLVILSALAIRGDAPTVHAQDIVVLLGPTELVRDRHQPNSRFVSKYEVAFTGEPGPAVLRLSTGSRWWTRARWGLVEVNGEKVATGRDLRRNGWATTEFPITIQAENTLAVKLWGFRPGLFEITIEQEEQEPDEPDVPPDTVVQEETYEVGPDGGTFILPDVAEVEFEPGTFVESIVDIALIESPYMDELAADTGIELEEPRIRIKSSTRPQETVRLTLFLDALGVPVPAGHEVDFVQLFRQEGPNSEVIDDVAPIGGRSCLQGTAACLNIPSGFFLPVNPADPEDPVIQLGIRFKEIDTGGNSNPYRLWEFSAGAPVEDESSGDLVFEAELELVQNFIWTSPILDQVTLEECTDITRHREIDDFLGTPVCIISTFLEPRNEPGRSIPYHGGLDLRTRLTLDPPRNGQIGVFAVQGGVNRQSRKTGGGGVRIFLEHDLAHDGVRHTGHLTSAYMHLLDDEGNLRMGIEADQGERIATSDSSGTDAPHLHLEAWFDGKRVDPQPLLGGIGVTGYLGYDLQLSIEGPSVRKTFSIKNVSENPATRTRRLAGLEIDSICDNVFPCTLNYTWSLNSVRLGGDITLQKAEVRLFTGFARVVRGTIEIEATTSISDCNGSRTTTQEFTAGQTGMLVYEPSMFPLARRRTGWVEATGEIDRGFEVKEASLSSGGVLSGSWEQRRRENPPGSGQFSEQVLRETVDLNTGAYSGSSVFTRSVTAGPCPGNVTTRQTRRGVMIIEITEP